MRVFITGGSGYIGSAVIQCLLKHGHQVSALARSDTCVSALTAAGVSNIVRGDLTDSAVLQEAASQSDGVIHIAFKIDFHDFNGSCAVDQTAIKALIEGLQGSNKPLIITTGTGSLSFTSPISDEETKVKPNPFAMRHESEILVQEATARKGIKGMVIRPPLTVHGEGDHVFIPMMISASLAKQRVGHVGNGANHWPAVHRLDIAELYCLALEKGKAGSIYHGVAEEAIEMKKITDLIAQKLHLPNESLTKEEMVAQYGFLGMVMALDHTCKSEKTKNELGWKPNQKGLLEDLQTSQYYFKIPGQEEQQVR